MIIDCISNDYECADCKALSEYCKENFPDRKGFAMCCYCVDKKGIVPVFNYQQEPPVCL